MTAAPTTSIPRITLNNGETIPQLGFGVYQIEPADTRRSTLAALEVGYRHIDTAEMYGNEQGVGEAVRESGLDRTDVFVTSKLNNGFHSRTDALAAFEQTLETLGFDYLDLFLIHWPLPAVGDFVETWKALEEMHASGRVKTIGVSNFQPQHLRRLLDETGTVPAVNQIEVHPYLTQDNVRAFNTQHGIVTEAWHLQRGDIVFPKSVTRSRVEENFALFDFELTADDLAAITALNRDERTGPDPDQFNWIP